MNGGLAIGKIWGIPLRLHGSWFVIFVLVAWSLAMGYFPQENPGLSPVIYWMLGAVTSLLFAASVLTHELGHSFVALRNKVSVNNVTLFIFGGIAQIDQEPGSPRAEFRIAVTGPLISLLLGLVFWGIWQITKPVEWISMPALWLGRMNLILGFFNLIPGFPLDGGRVLRSIIWNSSKNLYKATKLTAFSGQVFAFGFIVLGIFTLFMGNFFNGLWLAFIGWFLQNASHASVSQLSMRESLRGVRVSGVMQRNIPSIPSNKKLDCIIEEDAIPAGVRIFLVDDPESKEIIGLLTLRHVTAIPRKRWPELTAADVMIPRANFVTISQDMQMLDALRVMDDANVAQVPVISEGKVVGILTREDVTHYIRTRAEIGV